MHLRVKKVIDVEKLMIKSFPSGPYCHAKPPSKVKLTNNRLGGLVRFDYIPITMGTELGDLPECVRSAVSTIIESIVYVPTVQSPQFKKTASIREAILSHARNYPGWTIDFFGLEDVPFLGYKRNYVVDLVHDCEGSDGAYRCRTFVEVCFDNRQAVGTNILKLEASATRFENRVGGQTLNLLVCADRRMLDLGKWDSGVGDEEEYQIAITNAYREILKSNFALIVMRP